MIGSMMEVLITAGSIAHAGLLMRKDAPRARRVYALAFVLTVAACIGFGAAQGAAAAGMLPAAPAFSPSEVLSLAAILYWVSFAAEKGKMFRHVTGD